MLAALFLFPSPTPAAQDPLALERFQAGREAFDAGNFAAALQAFEAALAAGMSGPAIHFNIGVAAYRAGQHARARTAFNEVAHTPAMAALAHYNLGLVELQAGNRDAALDWFALTRRETNDQRLRTLAATQLAALAPPPAERSWMGYAALGSGYDDNVALTSSADVLGVSGTGDAFAELQLALSAPVEGPWRWDASLLALKYGDLTLFDQLGASAGGSYRLDLGRWTNEAGVSLSHTLLDGDGLENRRVFTLKTRTGLPAGWELRARYRFNHIEGLDGFEGLSGQRHDLSARLLRTFGPWEAGYELELQSARYDDSAFSVKRTQLATSLERSLPAQWTLGARAGYRISRYELAGNGREKLAELNLSAAKTLSPRWRLLLRYDFTDNDSPRPDFTYSRHRLAATLEAAF